VKVRGVTALSEGAFHRPWLGPGSAAFSALRLGLLSGGLTGLLVGCGGSSLPGPEDTTREFADAVERRDAKAVHALLDEASRERLTEADVASILEKEPAALEKRANAVATGAVASTVTLRYPGEIVTLRLDDGHLEVVDVTSLSLGASSAEQALLALRDALGRRDLPLLLRLFGREPGARVIDELRALEQSLEGLDGAAYERRGERVFVLLPDGRTIELSDRDGTFRIEGFE